MGKFMRTVNKRVIWVAMASLVIGLVFGGLMLTHIQKARAQGLNDIPVLLIHGFDDTCQKRWDEDTGLTNFLQNAGFTTIVTVGYYNSLSYLGDAVAACNNSSDGSSANLFVAQPQSVTNDIANNCNQLFKAYGRPMSDEGAVNDPIEHLGCALAWYIYDTYTSKGIPVDVVAHSMGGLIIRDALGESGTAVSGGGCNTPANGNPNCFPPPLMVDAVATVGTPHGGLSNEYADLESMAPTALGPQAGNVQEFQDMLVQGKTSYPTQTSKFMNLLAGIQDPKGASQTFWGLISAGIPYGFGGLGPDSTGPNPDKSIYNDAFISFSEEQSTSIGDPYPDGDAVIQASSGLGMLADVRIFYGGETYAGTTAIADRTSMYRHGYDQSSNDNDNDCISQNNPQKNNAVFKICPTAPYYFDDSNSQHGTTSAWICYNCGPTMDSLNVYNSNPTEADRSLDAILSILTSNVTFPLTPTPGSSPTPGPTSTPTQVPTIYAASHGFWGDNTGSTVDLMTDGYDSRDPGWHIVDASQALRNAGVTVPSLASNAGQPAIVHYRNSSGQIIVSVFANMSTGTIGDFTLNTTNSAWSFTQISAAVGLPTLSPVAEVNYPAVALFGVNSSGQVVEYYNNSVPGGAWSSTNVSAQTSVSNGCDTHISPSAFIFNGVTTEVFADCGQKLTQYFYASGWTVNQSFGGTLNIPNASENFPGHSISAAFVPGSNPGMEVYIASDKNGVNALTEAHYAQSGGWAEGNLTQTSFAPDQVSAQVTNDANGYTVSQAIVSSAAGTDCSTSNPASAQYAFVSDPNSPHRNQWTIATLPAGGITGTSTSLEQNGSVFIEAFRGAYINTGGCGSSTAQAVYEEYTALPNGGSWQSWSEVELAGGSLADPDNAGVEPVSDQFTYTIG